MDHRRQLQDLHRPRHGLGRDRGQDRVLEHGQDRNGPRDAEEHERLPQGQRPHRDRDPDHGHPRGVRWPVDAHDRHLWHAQQPVDVTRRGPDHGRQWTAVLRAAVGRVRRDGPTVPAAAPSEREGHRSLIWLRARTVGSRNVESMQAIHRTHNKPLPSPTVPLNNTNNRFYAVTVTFFLLQSLHLV